MACLFRWFLFYRVLEEGGQNTVAFGVACVGADWVGFRVGRFVVYGLIQLVVFRSICMCLPDLVV